MDIDRKYLIGIAAVLIVLVVFLYWLRNRQEKATSGSKSGSRSKSKSKSKSGKPGRRKSRDTEDETEPDVEQDSAETDDTVEDIAQELYNRVHDRMVNDMKSDEFLDVAGELADNLTYIELKQLYNDAKNKKLDSNQTVSIQDYAQVLDKRQKE